MAISLTSTNTSGAVNVNGVDVLTADATGNVSLRTAGATTALADLRSIGIGQTWQNVTASRALLTTYTNTSGRPIFVAVTNSQGASGVISATLNGLSFNGSGFSTAGGGSTSIFFIVPHGATYSVSGSGTPTLFSWHELRT